MVVLFQCFFHFFSVFFTDVIGACDADLIAEAEEPREEPRADDDGDGCAEGIFAAGDDHDVFAESVKDDADHVVVAFERDTSFVAAEHTEYAVAVCFELEVGKVCLSFSRFVCDDDIYHLVDAVMLDLVRLAVVGNEIILLIVPSKCPWADMIRLSAISEQFFLLYRPVKIAEPYLAIFEDGFVNGIDGIVYIFVDRLGTTLYDDMTIELLAS